MATHKPRLDPIHMGEAKIHVEVELSKAFSKRIAASDKTGFISMVDVEYAWLPTNCSRCGLLGHKEKRCLQDKNEVNKGIEEGSPAPISDVNEVNNGIEEEGSPAPISDVIEVNNGVEEEGSPAPISDQVDAIKASTQVQTTDSSVDDLHTPSASASAIIDKTPTTSSQPIEVSTANTPAPIESSFPSSMDDDLLSLATVSILENMCKSPTIICINDSMESPTLESAQKTSPTDDSIAKETSMVKTNVTRTAEPDFGSNKYALLVNVEEEEDSSDSDKELDPVDLTTPLGKRILRDRPVRPSAKAREMHGQYISRGRGNRGRGSRGRHG
ncbi:hypothetical protein Rs2_28328 [Raphanus sativus]|uniref:Uncharacterized protein LOC108831896 n=1 Tax=Raphanus sativus TaxID=3726 RepID=A0A6J0LNG8_RAPSA|nr:uncharacterized protein LOC108831896 [Raphanus sativus]KAJ4888580.1 hypothetical protein Rs2_28328 [Raphanus sativus]